MFYDFLFDIDALNFISSYLTGFLISLINILIAIVSLIFYLVILGLNLMYSDANIVYILFAQMVNLLLVIPNFFITLDTIAIAPFIPTSWHSIMIISVGVGVLIRLYRWLYHLKGWIPTMSGGS